MSGNWTCPSCGNNKYDLNGRTGRLACTVCGTEVQNEVDSREDLNYRKDMILAKKHLTVGNWNEAIQIVRKYEYSRPDDKQIYLFLLMATTKNFDDYLLKNEAALKQAESYYDKLRRLGGNNSEAESYFQDRISFIQNRDDEYNSTKVSIITAIVIASILTLAIMPYSGSAGVFFLIITIIGGYQGVKWIDKNAP